MALFSKEYLEAVGSTWQPDFSYVDELATKKDDSEVILICEGFGSIGAMTFADEPFLSFIQPPNFRKLSDEIEKVRKSLKSNNDIH